MDKFQVEHVLQKVVPGRTCGKPTWRQQPATASFTHDIEHKKGTQPYLKT